MQYWNAAHETNTFEFFCMRHMTPMPKGQTLRLHYHSMMQNAQTPDLSKQTDQVQDSPGKHMYLEKQDKQHCQVHSLNALLGQKAVSPRDMVKFCQLQTTISTSLAGMLQKCWFHATNGNFNTQVIMHGYTITASRQSDLWQSKHLFQQSPLKKTLQQ